MTKTFSEHLSLINKFDEETEIGDTVRSLADTSESLTSVGEDEKALIILDMADDIIKGSLEWVLDEGYGPGDDYYDEIDPEVFKYYLGKDKETASKTTYKTLQEISPELLQFVRLIAVGERVDGTYNYCREALRKKAMGLLNEMGE